MTNKLAGYLLAVTALGLGGWSYFVSAPAIEEKVLLTAQNTVPNSEHRTEITVAGRDITLSGLAQDAQEREALLAAAQDTTGRRIVNDALSVLDVASPYVFEVQKTQTGLFVSGNVPSEETRAVLSERLTADAGPLTLAAGAPDQNWVEAIQKGQNALSLLEEGLLTLSDAQVVISGPATDPYIAEDIENALAELPNGYTAETNLSIPEVTPYLFEVFKNGDAKKYNLFSPSRALETVVAEALNNGWTASVTPALGTPNDEWATAAIALARALSLAEDGQARIEGTEVYLTADAPTLEVQDEIEAALSGLPEGYDLRQVAIAVPPAIPYLFVGRKSADGLGYSGYIPSDLVRAEFATFIGEDAAALLERRAGMPDGFWPDFVKEGVAALGALEAGTMRIEGRIMQLTGVAANPIMATAIEGALADLPAGYGARFDLSLEDDGQPSFLAIAYEDGQPVSLTGKAPEGLTVDKARSALRVTEIVGEPRASVLAGEEFYLERLSALATVLPNYRLLNITFSEADAKISGVARPGLTTDALSAELIAIFGENTEIEIQETPLDVAEGTVRENELTGLVEIFRNGIWRQFNSEQELISSCDAQITALLSETSIQFQTGSAVIDLESENILNDLAAVLGPCLENSTAMVELGGHTDNQGDPDANLALSEARASAVRDAFLTRGIDATRISARGFGDTTPIADNTTSQGRAANRRTTFTWITN